MLTGTDNDQITDNLMYKITKTMCKSPLVYINIYLIELLDLDWGLAPCKNLNKK